jgi:hypothetical protein
VRTGFSICAGAFAKFSLVLSGFAVLLPAAASACQGGQFENLITRDRPVKTVPEGAVQLLVDVPYNEDELRSLDQGKVTLPVKKVLHGSYAEKSVDIEFQNSTSCDYFGPTGPELYVVVSPLLYDEGDPVKDDNGKPIVEAIRCNWSIDPKFLGKLAPFPDGPADILKERKMLSCIRRGREAEEAIEKCFDSKDPDSLYKQGSAGVYWIAVGFLTFAGVALAVRMKLKK